MSGPSPRPAPGDAAGHQAVLAAALAELPRFTAPGQLRDRPVQWTPDGGRAWDRPHPGSLRSPPLSRRAGEGPGVLPQI